MAIHNNCSAIVTLQKLDCQSCDPKLTVDAMAPGSKPLMLERDEMKVDETRRQTYAWMLGDNREGVIETKVTRAYDEFDGCGNGPIGGGCGCTTPDTNSPDHRRTGVLAALLVALLALRHRARRSVER